MIWLPWFNPFNFGFDYFYSLKLYYLCVSLPINWMLYQTLDSSTSNIFPIYMILDFFHLLEYQINISCKRSWVYNLYKIASLNNFLQYFVIDVTNKKFCYLHANCLIKYPTLFFFFSIWMISYNAHFASLISRHVFFLL